MESDTLLFIGKNYELIKKSLKKELRKNRNLEFDEDVFHDTLLKCIEKYNELKFQTDEEFIAYIIVSFKTNLKREKLYAVNAKRYDGEIEDFDSVFEDNDSKSNMDTNILIEKICKVFGEDTKNKMVDWLINQMTIEEINNKYNCNNARYTIDKVKKFIKQNYNRNDFVN